MRLLRSILLTAMLLLAAGYAGARDTSAAPPHVAVASLDVSTRAGWPLPAAGAPVVVKVRVRNATTCTFLAQRRTFSSLYPVKTVGCASGRATWTVPPIANSHLSSVHVTYGVRVQGADGQTVRRTVTVTQRAAAAAAPNGAPRQSTNWSGYVVPSTTALGSVGGRWTVPTLDCSATPNGGVAIWVGIGGYPSPADGAFGSLLQTGITADCIDGAQQNRAWWEQYPSEPNRSADFAGFPISPGDRIEAAVFVGPTGAWQTRVADLTTGLEGLMTIGSGWGIRTDSNGAFTPQGDTSDLSFSGGYTAEWIVEDYAELGSPVPLAAYGTVDFSDLSTSLPSWSLTGAEGIEIVQGGVVRSAPSAPTPAGFSVSYAG
ncbi:MAG TPA: G1 family glutamic endopeptidase [Gaiellaceae bacterium]|nr:G1 family glutamic endopeptidase [Gaiellaceae bacterium]